jgi:hypothetical protein
VTVPSTWRKRRLRVPNGLVLRYADLDDDARVWLGPVPITTPYRTLRDCLATHVSPELVEQAVAEARHRGLISPEHGDDLVARLEAQTGAAS